MKMKQLFCAFLALAFPFFASAQCKSHVKKQCLPKMAPYVHNGQMNSAVMLPGDNADISMTFYSGQNYRLIVCAQDQIGKPYFKLKDASGNILYDSFKDEVDHWDFKIESTQTLTIQVSVPDMSTDNKIVPSGCVSVLIGFKQ